MILHYVSFYFPGSLFPEESVRRIRSRDADHRLPKGAYGYQEWSQEVIKHDGEELIGNAKNFGPLTLFGVEYSREQVESWGPDYSILLSNMRGNGWESVVRTIRGNFQPVEKNTRVVYDERGVLKGRRSLIHLPAKESND